MCSLLSCSTMGYNWPHAGYSGRDGHPQVVHDVSRTTNTQL